MLYELLSWWKYVQYQCYSLNDYINSSYIGVHSIQVSFKEASTGRELGISY